MTRKMSSLNDPFRTGKWPHDPFCQGAGQFAGVQDWDSTIQFFCVSHRLHHTDFIGTRPYMFTKQLVTLPYMYTIFPSLISYGSGQKMKTRVAYMDKAATNPFGK